MYNNLYDVHNNNGYNKITKAARETPKVVPSNADSVVCEPY